MLRPVVERRSREGAFPRGAGQVDGAAPRGPRGPASAAVARLRTAGSLTGRPSPVGIGQHAEETWYKGGVGVS